MDRVVVSHGEIHAEQSLPEDQPGVSGDKIGKEKNGAPWNLQVTWVGGEEGGKGNRDGAAWMEDSEGAVHVFLVCY